MHPTCSSLLSSADAANLYKSIVIFRCIQLVQAYSNLQMHITCKVYCYLQMHPICTSLLSSADAFTLYKSSGKELSFYKITRGFMTLRSKPCLKTSREISSCVLIVAAHDWRHYIFIRFWKVLMEAAMLFAGSRLTPLEISSSLDLFVARDCMPLY